MHGSKLTTGEVAERTGVTAATVWRWIARGLTVGGVFLRLKAATDGPLSRCFLVDPADLEEFTARFRAAREGSISPRCRVESETEEQRRGAAAARRFLKSVGRA